MSWFFRSIYNLKTTWNFKSISDGNSIWNFKSFSDGNSIWNFKFFQIVNGPEKSTHFKMGIQFEISSRFQIVNGPEKSTHFKMGIRFKISSRFKVVIRFEISSRFFNLCPCAVSRPLCLSECSVCVCSTRANEYHRYIFILDGCLLY